MGFNLGEKIIMEEMGFDFEEKIDGEKRGIPWVSEYIKGVA